MVQMRKQEQRKETTCIGSFIEIPHVNVCYVFVCAQCEKSECKICNRMTLSLLVLHRYTMMLLHAHSLTHSLCIRKSNSVYRLQF